MRLMRRRADLPGDVIRVEEEGMPHHNFPSQRGACRRSTARSSALASRPLWALQVTCCWMWRCTSPNRSASSSGKVRSCALPANSRPVLTRAVSCLPRSAARCVVRLGPRATSAVIIRCVRSDYTPRACLARSQAVHSRREAGRRCGPLAHRRCFASCAPACWRPLACNRLHAEQHTLRAPAHLSTPGYIPPGVALLNGKGSNMPSRTSNATSKEVR